MKVDTRISEWVNLVNLNPEGPLVLIGDPPLGTIEGIVRFFDRIILVLNSANKKYVSNDMLKQKVDVRLITTKGRLPLSDKEASVLAVFPARPYGPEFAQEIIRSIKPSGDIIVFPVPGGKTLVGELKQIRKYQEYAFLPYLNEPRFIAPLAPRRVAAAAVRLYQPSRLAAKVKKMGYRVLSRLGLNSYLRLYRFYHFHKFPLKETDNFQKMVTEILGEKNIFLSLFTGTPPVRRKVTVQVNNAAGDVLGYARISPTPEVSRSFENEGTCLKLLGSLPIRHFIAPQLIYMGALGKAKFLLQSIPPGRLARGPEKIKNNHIESMAELYMASSKPMNVLESRTLVDIESRLSAIRGKTHKDTYRLLADGLHLIKKEIGDKNIHLGLAHGDFTPWNTRRYKGKLYIFDWEWARWDAPPFQDLFHFEISKRVFVDHDTAENIWDVLHDNHFKKFLFDYQILAGVSKGFERISLIWTLVDDVSYYLAGFIEEEIMVPEPHPFINPALELLEKGLKRAKDRGI